MPRSSRVQQVLLVALAGLLLVTGSAFATTFGSQLTWQQRDAVAVSAGEFAVHEGDPPTVTVELAVDNPLDRPVETTGADLVVYDGDPPFADDDPVSVRRSAAVPATTVPAGGERTVTVTLDLPADGVERARTAVDDGSASVSGTVRLELLGREFGVDV
ncbi:hypothetical protein [Candidatus Halobonum tyrrellensis]|uniref:Late embryogenesis abundant protein LEA-2 subgroup domain-containing protein n=1 Tax=Candidatus Halobonum tyrrellensis G22 TaxID=1324957 RepID=V4GW75_9EURY|nr:hypothetical protein [Candidatus Halobonum tyrrellensis]ESP89401.1 hypothetical protein K933_04196 [Candidatus Halobonum tyrrellensis G22]